jgi:hypothetical protein
MGPGVDDSDAIKITIWRRGSCGSNFFQKLIYLQVPAADAGEFDFRKIWPHVQDLQAVGTWKKQKMQP